MTGGAATMGVATGCAGAPARVPPYAPLIAPTGASWGVVEPWGVGAAPSAARPPDGNSSWRLSSAPISRQTADSTLTTIDHITRGGVPSTTPAMSRTMAARTSAALMRITGVLRATGSL
ncbi:hypothetical protein DI270_034760 [Microbispora triticiradicis]|uniref:Uncharacterized protein n=1 Tax=Microbispora triticiradicis TaxID=2200763 RepID=A0ABX9L9W0_9ACTN|nr:hypothetical protein DI270_034760 [Microbispora triticiradicis]